MELQQLQYLLGAAQRLVHSLVILIQSHLKTLISNPRPLTGTVSFSAADYDTAGNFLVVVSAKNVITSTPVMAYGDVAVLKEINVTSVTLSTSLVVRVNERVSFVVLIAQGSQLTVLLSCTYGFEVQNRMLLYVTSRDRRTYKRLVLDFHF